MQLTLLYRGDIKSANSANRRDKQRMRRVFHRQLRAAWKELKQQKNEGRNAHHEPWEPYKKTPKDGQVSLLKWVKPFNFAPTVSSADGWHAQCRISFHFCLPADASFGDIDNKVKTLVDSLRMPKCNELPDGDVASEDEDPFYCLMENDELLQSYTVTKRRILDQSEPFVLIDADVFAIRKTLFNDPIW